MKIKIRIAVILLMGISLGTVAQVNDTGDKVGIGIESPNSKLHVKNTNGNASLIVQGKQDANINNSAQLILSTEYSTANNLTGTQSGRKAIIKASSLDTWGQTVKLAFYTSNYISTYPQERMSIMPSGNVGIGTTNTNGWKLAVNGKIRAKEINVETGWSDFVFEKDYNLPTLKEVENYINEKGHLKDIPCAKEVEKNGILLGEMDSKLLQKIEELTLYTIQQEKKINEQKSNLKKQELEITELKTLNQKLLELQKRLEKLESK